MDGRMGGWEEEKEEMIKMGEERRGRKNMGTDELR